MKKKILITGVFAVLVAAFAWTLQADAFPPGKQAPGGYAGIGQGIGAPILEALIRLDLSTEQKQEIAGIMKKYREQISSAIENSIRAHRSVREAVHKQPYDETAVRAACAVAADADTEFAVLRAKIWNEIAGVLTGEQLQTLAEMKEQVEEKIRKRIEQVQELIDLWVRHHGG